MAANVCAQASARKRLCASVRAQTSVRKASARKRLRASVCAQASARKRLRASVCERLRASVCAQASARKRQAGDAKFNIYILKATPWGINTSSMIVFVHVSYSTSGIDNPPNYIRCLIGSDCNSIPHYLRFLGIWEHCVYQRMHAVDTQMTSCVFGSWKQALTN